MAVPPAILMMALAYWQTRDVIRREIESSLQAQAETLAAKLRQGLDERLQAVEGWRALEVMQDLAVNDVDKRLSAFLLDTHQRHPTLFTRLDAVGLAGAVVASSDPAALGAPAVLPEGCTVPPSGAALCLPPEPDRADAEGIVVASLRSRFDNARIGTLQVRLDWREEQGIVDAAAADGQRAWVDDDAGRRVVASEGLRHRAASSSGPWLTATVRLPAPATAGSWATHLQQSYDSAFAPIRAMAWAFAGLLAAAGVLIVLAASWFSARIAQPLVRLSAAALTLGDRGELPVPDAAAPREIHHLRESLARMVADLEAQRQTLIRAAKLAAVGEFAAIMAHEIRTPLGIIRSSVQTIDAGLLDAQSQELLGYIESESQRLERLVNALLDQARARPAQRQPEHVDALVARAVAMVRGQARDKQIRIECQSDAADPVVAVDAEQLLQVLFNLMRNAIQILPAGGRILLHSQDDSESWRLTIADDGPGIPLADHQAVFEPFVHRREGGTGIGLAVVREIIRAHGGDIRLRPVARGACFEIRLPKEI